VSLALRSTFCTFAPNFKQFINHRIMKNRHLAAAIVAAVLLAACSQDETEDLPGILINGVRWAPTNVAAPGIFATSTLDDGMFYQWGRRTGGWNAVDSLPPVSSPAGDMWESTPLSGERWESVADPCPEGWRLPTQNDFYKLLDAEKVSYRGTADKPDDGGGGGIPGWNSRAGAERDVVILSSDGDRDAFDRDGLKRRGNPANHGGVIFTDRLSGEQLFFPAAGMRYRDEGELMNADTDGFYWMLWEGTLDDDDTDLSVGVVFFKVFIDTAIQSPDVYYSPDYGTRLEGYSVRCVLK
jgi:hypothetical protein